MLLNTTGADYAKVLDFGIAKIQEPTGEEDPGLTSPDLIIGTPQYMSPEQCSQSEQIDSRSDIYSLGVILFEMLVGHVPFVGDSPTAVMLKHLQELPASVLDERKDLPKGVATVVAKALAKRREDRYQTAEELVEDLVIAEGTGLVQPELGDRNANRIVVPTQERTNEVPVEDDEQTLCDRESLHMCPRIGRRSGDLRRHRRCWIQPVADCHSRRGRFGGCIRGDLCVHAHFSAGCESQSTGSGAGIVCRSKQPGCATCGAPDRSERAGIPLAV